MSERRYRVEFGAGHPPVELREGTALSEGLDIRNSPVLFGCRTGLCGTCAVRVEALAGGRLDPPDPEELEVLELVATDPSTRLACQLRLRCHIRIEVG